MGLQNLKKYYNDNKLLINCAIVAILFFVNCFIEGFSIIVFALVAGFIIFSNISIGFSLLVFTIPYCCLDDFNSIYLFFGCLLIFLVRSYIVMLFVDKKKLPWPFVISVIIFIIYSFLPFGDYNWAMVIKMGIILLLVLFFNLLLMYSKELNIKLNISILAVSMVISVSFYLTYFISPYMASKKVWSNGDDFIRFTALFPNPNNLAMLSEICLALLTYYVLRNKFNWIDTISYITFAVLGISSLSKTFLILFLVMLFILFIWMCKRFSKQIFWTIIAVCTGIILIAIFASDYLFTYLNRFMFLDPENLTLEEILNVITTYRYGLWKSVIDYLLMNPIVLVFGRGLGAPLIESISAHNFYLSMVYEIGIVGSLLFVSMFVILYFCHKKRTKFKFHSAIFVPILIIGMLMMVEDLFLYIY